MKYRVLGISLMFLLAGAVCGQSRYDIPFSFHAGGKLFQPGSYEVGSGPTETVLKFKPTTGLGIMLLPHWTVRRNDPAPAGSLVFRRYGNVYFLSEVWTIGRSVGRKLPESRAEREMAKNATAPQEAAVLASVR